MNEANNNEEMDPQVRQALASLKAVPPRDPRRAQQGRAAFLAEAARLAAAQQNSPQAVSSASGRRLKEWIRQIQQILKTRKESFAMRKLSSAIAAILLLILFTFGGGVLVAHAADGAVPGDALYPVDLAAEQVQLALTASLEQKAELRAQFAQERVQEIQTLLQEGKVDQIPAALQNLETQLAATAQLTAQMEQKGDTQAARRVAQMVAQSTAALQQVMQHAPAQAQGALQQALSQTAQAQERVDQIVRQGGADTFHLTGTVEAVGDGTLTVNGVTVQVAPGTAMPQGEAQVGDFVTVTGMVDPATGAWVAVEVKVTPGQGKGQQRLTFEGTVESLSQDEIVVGGQTLQLTDATKVKGDLQVGSVVEVQAYLDPNGNLVAAKVIAKGAPAGMGQGTPGATVRFSGIVSSVSDDQIVVNGQPIQIDASTVIHGNLQVGSMVEVVATLNADGAYVAQRVQVKGAAGQGQGGNGWGNGTPPSPTATPGTPGTWGWGGNGDQGGSGGQGDQGGNGGGWFGGGH